MEFITIDVINTEQQHPSYQDIIILPMNPIINSSFNKYPVSWELIHRCLLYPPESVMKVMCRNQTLTSLPKHYPNKPKQVSCTICYREKMKTPPKATTFDTNNFQPVELMHKAFAFYNMTSIRVFTSMLTVVCENNRTL